MKTQQRIRTRSRSARDTKSPASQVGPASRATALSAISLDVQAPSHMAPYASSLTTSRMISTSPTPKHTGMSPSIATKRSFQSSSNRSFRDDHLDILTTARMNTIPILETKSHSLLRVIPSRGYQDQRGSKRNLRSRQTGQPEQTANNDQGYSDHLARIKQRQEELRAMQAEQMRKIQASKHSDTHRGASFVDIDPVNEHAHSRDDEYDRQQLTMQMKKFVQYQNQVNQKKGGSSRAQQQQQQQQDDTFVDENNVVRVRSPFKPSFAIVPENPQEYNPAYHNRSPTLYRPKRVTSVHSKDRKIEPDYIDGRPYYDVRKYPEIFPKEIVKLCTKNPDLALVLNFLQTSPTHDELIQKRREDPLFDSIFKTVDPNAVLDSKYMLDTAIFGDHDDSSKNIKDIITEHRDTFYNNYDPHDEANRGRYRQASPKSGEKDTQGLGQQQLQPGLLNNPNFAQQPVQLVNISPDLLMNKTVLVRMDFNVNIEKDDATNDFVVRSTSYKRLLESLPTIQYLIESGANIVLMSHLGDPKKGERDPQLSLRPVAKALSDLLMKPVTFVEDCIGDVVSEAVQGTSENSQQQGQGKIVLLENLRFHPGEKKNDPEFVQQLISSVKPDVYVNDAFGTSHRAHASILGIPTALKQFHGKGQEEDSNKSPVPCVSGLLVSKELDAFTPFINVHPLELETTPKNRLIPQKGRPERTLILGGAKLKSKLPVIQGLLPYLTCLIVGGQLAFPFICHTAPALLEAAGADIKKFHKNGMLPSAFRSSSREEVEMATTVINYALNHNLRALIPNDLRMGNPHFGNSAPARSSDCIEVYAEGSGSLQAYDVGHKTVSHVVAILNDIRKRHTVDQAPQFIFWNGPFGKFEMDNFGYGTEAIIEELSKCTKAGVVTLIGGGETSESIEVYKQKHPESDLAFTHISTGGGASLELLSGTKILPGLDALDKI